MGERLARARGGLGQDVAAGQHVADDEALDGEGGGEAAGGERLAHGLGHAEIGE
jgi:hypothetical protein